MNTQQILAARPPRNSLDPFRPWAFFVEPECSAKGDVVDVATAFLTNRECPFHCLMCDLWKNTLKETVPIGAIPIQIDYAIERLPPARQIKLYNSGNFFDPKAIPREDYPEIARRVAGFERVIVENHPRFCDEHVVRFRDLLESAGPVTDLQQHLPPRTKGLELAIGLETVHPDVLPRLNKQMTLDDFADAAAFLRKHDIAVRAFILLRPPFLTDDEGVEWALRSARFAFDHGVECCSIIPTRGGNGAMDRLQGSGQFAPPSLAAMEAALAEGLVLGRGRVFIDLWDVERFFDCPTCGPRRAERLRRMNLSQRPEPAIACNCR